MKSNNAAEIAIANKFRLVVESLIETIEMYNYSIRFYGKIDQDYFSTDNCIRNLSTFVMRIDLYEEGPEENVNGTCTFFDGLVHQDMNIFLELGDTERQRLTALLKEALNRGDRPKFLLELQSIDLPKDGERDGFLASDSRDIINIKFELETGIKRNYFS